MIRIALAFALFAAGPAGARDFTLEPTPQTIVWGHFDATTPPALRIASGDRVTFRTLLTNSPEGLEAMGLPADEVEPALRRIYREPPADKGPGSHILTGPVYVDGAEPGDVLEVRIERIEPAIPYAYNMFRPGMGYQTDDFPYARQRIVRLDRAAGVARFGPGVTLPLRPFFGDMGVAPPPAMGRLSSGPPSLIGANMDNKELVAGTSVFFPVYARGALFQLGDGHAGQGNGEVDVTALETSLIGTMRFVVHKGLAAGHFPRAETPTHYLSMGFDGSLEGAAHKAIAEMIDFLVAEKHLTRDDAYVLVSVAGDLDTTEVVDGNMGMQVLLPKAIFAQH